MQIEIAILNANCIANGCNLLSLGRYIRYMVIVLINTVYCKGNLAHVWSLVSSCHACHRVVHTCLHVHVDQHAVLID